jgi:hypothetical protein
MYRPVVPSGKPHSQPVSCLGEPGLLSSVSTLAHQGHGPSPFPWPSQPPPISVLQLQLSHFPEDSGADDSLGNDEVPLVTEILRAQSARPPREAIEPTRDATDEVVDLTQDDLDEVSTWTSNGAILELTTSACQDSTPTPVSSS